MTEDEARCEVERMVGASATERLSRLVGSIIQENDRQNLIAKSTVPTVWVRHVLDSIQLVRSSDPEGYWIDVGTGGGFPGLAIAIATGRPMLLVEPRRQRATFLAAMCEEFELRHVHVEQRSVERVVDQRADIISARAVAPLHELFGKGQAVATSATRWILPRGSGWQADIASANIGWSATFHVEQSLSDPHARIVIAEGVKRR